MKLQIEQGSEEWRLLRKFRITATDAPIILGLSPYKTSDQLMEEKLGSNDNVDNEAMQRGRLMEPVARDYFISKTGIKVEPSVHVGTRYKSVYSVFEECSDNWAMCSTDGICEDEKIVLEIKCGKKSYADASSNRPDKYKTLHESRRIPDYYYTQMQHILWITEAKICFYMCFNGQFDITLPVKRNDAFIDEMIKKEYEFYQEMQRRRENGSECSNNNHNRNLSGNAMGNVEISS